MHAPGVSSCFGRSVAMLGIALLALGCGGGGGGGSPTAPPSSNPETIVVEIRDDAFVPRSVRVDPGDTVRWVYRGTHPGHTVTEGRGLWDSGMVFNAQGDSYARTFTGADQGLTFLYYCRSHQACCQMQGSVQVGENAPRPDPGYE